MRFYKDKEHSDKSTAYMFIEEVRLLWKKLLNEGWEKTSKKWLGNSKINFFFSENK